MTTKNNISLENALSLVSYNSDNINISQEKPNICMGIGLWSKVNGLSIGLPIDVMHMLMTATILCNKNQSNNSKLIIILADSMAKEEGADINELRSCIEAYKKALNNLLDILKMKEDTEIICLSSLENNKDYENICESIKSNEKVQWLTSNDPGHSKYIISQTAIINYLHIHKNVGVKIGWIYKESNYPMAYSTIAAALKKWDELKFDRYYKEICSDKLEFLYCRAGIEKLNKGNIQEACPYIAYSKDSRYILDYSNTQQIPKNITKQWDWIPKILELQISNNDVVAISHTLNHWLNHDNDVEILG
ncbi:MAG: hypothetical protein LN546_04860 [Rickettsia endosymbiont of Ecitomorpha arachnoides]|nr:hypothetical protein [Rickettsia endosymbiont of Ecitomorpha arachnoides]